MIFRRNRSKQKILLIGSVLLTTVIYIEFIVYELKKYTWSSKDCPECVRLLLVADPQLIGVKNENHMAAWLTRWDSDRYLQKTFSIAMRHSQPHVIAFLGDLMDEGHIATKEQFKLYKNRFDAIFSTPEDIMKIYLPGDNDIGGEEDMVSSKLVDRFNFAFTQPDTLVYKSATFFKVNRLSHSMPEAPKYAFLYDYTERNTTNVVLSHMPLLFLQRTFVQDVIKRLSPQIIFSAHQHKAMHISLDTTTELLSDVRILPVNKSPLYQLRLDMGDIHELQVPTCSYRMGTLNVGYGLTYIDTPGKEVTFTILWLPGRFLQLGVYVIVGILVIIYLFCVLLCNYRTKNRVTYSQVPKSFI